MLTKYLVKATMFISFYTQVATLLVGLSALLVKLPNNMLILREVLILENLAQLIEGSFYMWFLFFDKVNVDIVDITKFRYYDWFLSTPIMLISMIAYFQYNNTKNNLINLNLVNLIKSNYNNITKILTYNFVMLLTGYLYEINLSNVFTTFIIGFIFFILLFLQLYISFARKSKNNITVFFLMLIIWSFYGFAILFNYKVKNTLYNILDLFSKNFYGLFLSYLILKK
tara:strand:+ start:285 stop:965 length:681 start_codon:yes stop_codon:yes gene_type:complete